MNRVEHKICPLTCSDEITIKYPDPNELVLTQRKTSEGKYEKVMRPRREVKNGLLPQISCPSLGHPLLDAPKPLSTQLHEDRQGFCRKTVNVCPIDKILDSK